MDKYYTPTIEEFYIGFEVEVKHNDGTWNKLIYEEDHLVSIMFEKKAIEEENIRVKYLDKKDIESLGFSMSEYNYYEKILVKPKNVYKLPLKIYVWHTEENMISINKGIDLLNSVPLFRGKIKNKSELVKLLKQIQC